MPREEADAPPFILVSNCIMGWRQVEDSIQHYCGCGTDAEGEQIEEPCPAWREAYVVFVGREVERGNPGVWKKLLCVGDTDKEVIEQQQAAVQPQVQQVQQQAPMPVQQGMSSVTKL